MLRGFRLSPIRSSQLNFARVHLLQIRCYSTHDPRPHIFNYRISAAYSAKTAPLNLPRDSSFHHPSPAQPRPPPLALSHAKRLLARPKSGQDAFFIADVNASRAVAFAVVDGVGGWQDSGVDPANFSHSLCEYMAASCSAKLANDAPSRLRPVELLDAGYSGVMADANVHAGGSTACVGVASADGILEIANLGDSGYIHLSPLRISHTSTPQTHAFNTPYQLSKVPSRIARQLALFADGGQHYSEMPADADVYSHALAHGDVFVLASDGVWDNLAPEDVLRIVSADMVRRGAWVLPREDGGEAAEGGGAVRVGSGLAEVTMPRGGGGGGEGKTSGEADGEGDEVELSTGLARAIVLEAKHASVNTRRDGPFAKEVKKKFPWEDYRGGKMDDICCVVGIVLQDRL